MATTKYKAVSHARQSRAALTVLDYNESERLGLHMQANLNIATSHCLRRDSHDKFYRCMLAMDGNSVLFTASVTEYVKVEMVDQIGLAQADPSVFKRT